jgi:hypothetical protein
VLDNADFMQTHTDARATVGHEVHWEDFLWALGAVCELRRIPFDGELFVRQFPPPYSVAKLIAVLSAHGVPVHMATTDALRGYARLPCIAFQRAERDAPAEPPRKVAIIARCDKRHALAINCLSQGTFAVPFALLNEVFEPLVLYFAPAA